MDVYKSYEFNNWKNKVGISDESLLDAIRDIHLGNYEANLGGNIYKKRIALGNRGKSAGIRTILAFKINNKAFFIYGFAKNKMDNVNEKELKALKQLARFYLDLNEEEINKAIKLGKLIKVEGN